MSTKPKLLRITTVPISLKLLLRGQLTFMQQQGFEVLAVSADGPEVKDLAEEHIAHQVVSMTRKITPWADFVSLVKLIRLMYHFKPDIVHTHTPKAGLLGMMAARFCGISIRLHTVAGLPVMEAQGLKRKLLMLTERLTYACASEVYPNSLGLKRFMDEHLGGSRAKYKVLGKGSSNGIDVDYFSRTASLESDARLLRTAHTIGQDEIVFSFVGRIVRDKGINELIRAFVRITHEVRARLILVGPFEEDLDPVEPEVRQLIETHPSIIAMGFQRDVRVALMASDVFVFPSYREGFPNVVMQACCLEVPCIVSDINGCNEIITDRENGLIVSPKDEKALYEAMKYMAMNSDMREEFRSRAKKFVTAYFSQKHIWALILDEYRKKLISCT